MIVIDTPHLQLIAYSAEQLLCLVERPEQFAGEMGFPAAPGLRGFIVSDEVSPAFLARLRAAKGTNPWHQGFAVVHRESRSVIGNAGFKGPPDGDGVVEIAYGIVPGYEGRGYATEAAAALVSFASESGAVRVVRAHTLPEVNASGTVLTRCGFRRVEDVVDPEDGPVWRWERAP